MSRGTGLKEHRRGDRGGDFDNRRGDGKKHHYRDNDGGARNGGKGGD